MKDNHFVFVCPMYNASKTFRRLLHSLYGQSYDGWRAIVIDDVSSDDEFEACVDALERFDRLDGSSDPKVTLIRNNEKKWEVENVLQGISLCDDDDILCRIDADDFLCDLDALRVVNLVYQQTSCDALWTAHRWFDDVRYTDNNISGHLPDGADPYAFPWVSSHLKTWRAGLSRGINDLNYRGEDGNYIKRAGDQAVYLPVLHRARKRVYLPRVMYAYRCDMSPQTFQTDDARFQKREAEFLRARGFVE